ncbi:Uma2 family endonuclease [Blastomonas sp.]|uniref:Uma2 family endonuclease n=1 Tax=Blastomonas sp. TaxID=1909299 RepID=UPI003593741F
MQIDFGSDIKAELDNGIIRMMAGGTAAHARIQSNLTLALGLALRGSGCRPYGSDMGLQTHEMSVRYPDVSVYCGKDSELFDNVKAFDDPVLLVEVLSPSTATSDAGVKLNEYRAIPSVQTILMIDPVASTVRSITRTGPQNWIDNVHGGGEDIAIPHLKITLSHTDIFAR